jgi:hypothetical protein
MNGKVTWQPRMGSYEYYSRWALERYRPCEQCSEQFREVYEQLKLTVESADQLFEMGYQLYADLSRMDEHI